MKTYDLSIPNFINPMWLNKYKYGTYQSTVKDGCLILGGEKLFFKNDFLPDNTNVMIWLGSHNFICVELTEYLEYLDNQKLLKEIGERQYLESLQATKKEATEFNSRLILPFRWEVGQKDVLSGLNENRGDGRNNRSVNHILLLEDIRINRLVRFKDWFLCSSNNNDNGKRYSSVITRCFDGQGNEFAPKVTCKKCLQIANKLTNSVKCDIVK